MSETDPVLPEHGCERREHTSIVTVANIGRFSSGHSMRDCCDILRTAEPVPL